MGPGLPHGMERSDLSQLRERVLAKRTRWLAWAESFVILGLLVWVSIEYESNQYLQTWLEKSIGPLGFLLNGTLAGLYGGALLGYAVAMYTTRRSEEERILESITRKKSAIE